MAKKRDELELLRTRLSEAEETLEAIRSGEVDALVVGGAEGDQIYTLRGADHPYRLLLQEMNEGAATVTPEGTVLYCNKRFAAMLRRPIEKVIGYTLDEFTEFRSQTLLEALLRSGRHIRVKEEIAFTTPDGRIPVYCSISPLHLDDLECLVLVATDLTEQKRSEELLASGKLAREILEHAVDVIVVCDENGNITHASSAAHELAGGNVLQRHFDNVFRLVEKNGVGLSCSVTTGGAAGDSSIIATCLEGRTIQGAEVEFVRPDGRKFDLLMSAGPLRDAREQSRGCVFTLTDISGLKAAEEELKRSQGQLSAELSDTKLLQRISAALVGEEDAQGLYETILDAAVAVMRSDFASMQILHPERGNGGGLHLIANRGFTPEAEKLWEWVNYDTASSCSAALRGARRVIITDVKKAQQPPAIPQDFYLEQGIQAMQSTPLLSRAGNVVGMISTHWRTPHDPSERDLRLLDILARQAADLIERKRAEEALRESEDMLRRQARELEQQLIASGRLVSLGEITASMAHEFNNPLGIVLGFVDDLLMDKPPSDPEYQALKIMQDETKRCQKLIQDMMQYSRPRSMEKNRCDAGEIVQKSMQLVASRLQKQKVETTVEIEPDLPPIEADRRQIEQVLVNLYLNAMDAMPGGGKLNVSVRCDGEASLAIAVSDTGMGITDDDLPKIFQPFFSARKKSGLGLGLPICSRIVANHGGKIEVESRPGTGTTFRISLPAECAEAALKKQSAA
ncbi:MAG TPA: ATP-binding protein [Candidatus Binatia bacterium]